MKDTYSYRHKFLTRHGIFKNHLFDLCNTENKSEEEKVETTSHLLHDCPRYAYHIWLFLDHSETKLAWT